MCRLSNLVWKGRCSQCMQNLPGIFWIHNGRGCRMKSCSGCRSRTIGLVLRGQWLGPCRVLEFLGRGKCRIDWFLGLCQWVRWSDVVWVLWYVTVTRRKWREGILWGGGNEWWKIPLCCQAMALALCVQRMLVQNGPYVVVDTN